MSPAPYVAAVILSGVGGTALCLAARRSTGRWRRLVARAIGVLLGIDAATYFLSIGPPSQWTLGASLPLALCNMAALVAVAACWTGDPLLVELTWFWGLAGALQAVITPDLNVGFPHLVFFQYVIGHLGIVLGAVYLVVGLSITPRRGAAVRIFAITVIYTAFVGLVDAVTGGNYMFLRQPPSEWTLLQVLGPWPWYIASATGVAGVLVLLLDAPFVPGRRRAAASCRDAASSGAASSPAAA